MSNRHIKWTDDQVAYLTAHKDDNIQSIEAFTGRTAAAIKQKLHRLGLSRQSQLERFWIECEDNFLRANLAMGWEAIGRRLHRTPEAVEFRYKRLRRANRIAKRPDPRRASCAQQIGGAA